MKKICHLTSVFLFLFLFAFVSLASAADKQMPTLKLVGNSSKSKSILSAKGEKIALAGRTSIYLEATEEDFKSGRLRVKGLNLLYSDVPQAVLTYDKISRERKGALGFALDPNEGPQYLSYDEKDGTLYGKLRGYIDAEFMTDTLFKTDKDLFETPKQTADIEFKMELKTPLAFEDKGKELTKIDGAASFHIEAYEDIRSEARSFSLYEMEFAPIVVETTVYQFFEVARHLKIQPVRIGWRITLAPHGIVWTFYSGDGLGFGLPQLRAEWAKADVIFTINDWITVWDSSYWVFDISESADLRSEVAVDDAVEVFFVYNFSPESMWGGGATYGSGTAGSKIITSDGNARGGIDFTHLAHEVGHSMGLLHPDGTPGVSTGTLMCPSGWMNDNPQANSQENEDNLSNPLFTFAFKLYSPGPDCTDSADCGPCD